MGIWDKKKTPLLQSYQSANNIVPWCRPVNDIDFCCSPKSPKKSIKLPILAFKVIPGHWIRLQSRASVRLPISD